MSSKVLVFVKPQGPVKGYESVAKKDDKVHKPLKQTEQQTGKPGSNDEHGSSYLLHHHVGSVSQYLNPGKNLIQDTRWFYCLFMYTIIHI